jgi:surfeit locus 1 family protein
MKLGELIRMQTYTLQVGKFQIRLNFLGVIITIVLSGTFISLGVWQLRRAQEKIDLQNSYTELAKADASELTQLPFAGLPYDRQQHQNRHVQFSGQYLNDRNIFLIYATHEDQIGFEVLTPLALENDDRVVLVSRGWRRAETPESLQASLDPIAPDETVNVEGQLFVPEDKEVSRKNQTLSNSFPLVRRYVNITELSANFEQELIPYVVRLAEGQLGILVRFWPEVFVQTSQHFSYALQWFAMAIAVVIVSLILGSNVREFWNSLGE